MGFNFNDSFGHKLEIAARIMSNRLNQRFKSHDFEVTAEQWALINILVEHEDVLSQNDIAKIVVKDYTSISRLIDHLIKKELVVRKSDPNDRRSNLIYITDKGKKLQKEVIEEVLQHIADALDGISKEELEICSSVLLKVIRNLK